MEIQAYMGRFFTDILMGVEWRRLPEIVVRSI
jgi:hypothetical protein